MGTDAQTPLDSLHQSLVHTVSSEYHRARHDVCCYSIVGILMKIWQWEESSVEEFNAMRRSVHIAGARFWWPGRQRRVFIEERDQILAHAIKAAPGERVVAVVGLAHLAGIRRYWNCGSGAVPDALFQEPKRNISAQVASCLLLLSFPACMRIKSKLRRRATCGLIVAISSSTLGSSGRYSFFE